MPGTGRHVLPSILSYPPPFVQAGESGRPPRGTRGHEYADRCISYHNQPIQPSPTYPTKAYPSTASSNHQQQYNRCIGPLLHLVWGPSIAHLCFPALLPWSSSGLRGKPHGKRHAAGIEPSMLFRGSLLWLSPTFQCTIRGHALYPPLPLHPATWQAGAESSSLH
jgi:hypothetical protein